MTRQTHAVDSGMDEQLMDRQCATGVCVQVDSSVRAERPLLCLGRPLDCEAGRKYEQSKQSVRHRPVWHGNITLTLLSPCALVCALIISSLLAQVLFFLLFLLFLPFLPLFLSFLLLTDSLQL